MKIPRINTLSALTVLAVAALAACSSVPAGNAMLEQAHSDYSRAQANTQTQALAPMELKQAGDAVALADSAFAKRESTAQVNQLAYLAQQRVALARETASRKASETEVAAAGAERDRARLAARTREADAANLNAAVANSDAMSAQRQAEASQRQAAASQQQAAASNQQAAAAQQMAAASQQQAGDAERRSQALEAQLRDLNAKKTERGMVITIGDVLFNTGQSDIKTGGLRNIERLGGFLKDGPQRKALIEGYTDSTGGDEMNLALSERRAQAVLAALVGMGVGRSQLTSHGYGVARPVAGNETSGGRQLNRRVEIVLSDESGTLNMR